MKIDSTRFELALARIGENASCLRNVTSPDTLARIRRGEDVLPKTVGKIARALGVDPAELIADKKEA